MSRFLPSLSVCCIIGSAACWGGATVFSKVLLDSMPSLMLLVIQLVASVIALLILHLVTMGVPKLSRGILLSATLGVFEPGMAYLLALYGLARTSATNACLLSALEPVMVALLAVLFLGERLSRTEAFLGILAICCSMLLNFEELSLSSFSLKEGDLYIIAGTAAAAVYVILSRNAVRTHRALLVALMQQATGLIVASLAFMLSGGFRDIPREFFSTELIILAACSGIIQYALAFFLYLLALRDLKVSSVSIYLSLIPLFGMATAWIFLVEPLSIFKLFIGVLLVALIYAFSRARRREELKERRDLHGAEDIPAVRGIPRA